MRESISYREIEAEGEQRLLLRMATERFGKPPKLLVKRLMAIFDTDELERLGVTLLSATDWKDWMSTSRGPA